MKKTSDGIEYISSSKKQRSSIVMVIEGISFGIAYLGFCGWLFNGFDATGVILGLLMLGCVGLFFTE